MLSSPGGAWSRDGASATEPGSVRRSGHVEGPPIESHCDTKGLTRRIIGRRGSRNGRWLRQCSFSPSRLRHGRGVNGDIGVSSLSDLHHSPRVSPFLSSLRRPTGGPCRARSIWVGGTKLPAMTWGYSNSSERPAFLLIRGARRVFHSSSTYPRNSRLHMGGNQDLPVKMGLPTRVVCSRLPHHSERRRVMGGAGRSLKGLPSSLS